MKGPIEMPITDLLERNAKLYGNEVALVEINPELQEKRRITWKEYDLIMPAPTTAYRRKRPTGWRICSWPGASAGATRWPSC